MILLSRVRVPRYPKSVAPPLYRIDGTVWGREREREGERDRERERQRERERERGGGRGI